MEVASKAHTAGGWLKVLGKIGNLV